MCLGHHQRFADDPRTHSQAARPSSLRFAHRVPLSSQDSPRASNADPFSCLLVFHMSRLFSFAAVHNRPSGGIGQGLGVSRQSATALHWGKVSASSCPHALQGRSIPTTNEGVGIFFAPMFWRRTVPVRKSGVEPGRYTRMLWHQT